MSRILLFLTLILFSTTGLEAKKATKHTLTSIHIVDRNGQSETITTKDRLEKYTNVNFLHNQPYEKVLRVYTSDGRGNVPAFITTYHPNGQIKQYLEVVNSRAQGLYQEWHANGEVKLFTQVVGGAADLSEIAQNSWLFDGCSTVLDEEGNVVAKMQYKKGVLDGETEHFYSNGNPSYKVTYVNGSMEGDLFLYDAKGTLLQKTPHSNGVPHGDSTSYWPSGQIAAEEEYYEGLLLTGTYFNEEGEEVAAIVDGEGKKMILNEQGIREMQEYSEGVQQGLVTVYTPKGRIEQTYHVKNGEKHGEETIYHPNGKPKLSISWYEGTINGTVKSWYLNGSQESARELSKNAKQGHLFAWYPTGDLMLIEDYDNDKLVKGQYFKKGEKDPVSQVTDGKGTATIFNKEGMLSHKIPYENGRPVVTSL